MKPVTALLLLLACLHVSTPASAQTTWHQCSQAPVVALAFFTVGEVSLARPDCALQAQWSEPPLQLTFAYHHAVPGDAFARSSLEMIRRNIDPGTFARLEPRLRAFNSVYRDIDAGDAYRLRYLHGDRVELWLNDTLLTQEQGKDFALAYLSIWFGQDPYSDKMKRLLLGSR